MKKALWIMNKYVSGKNDEKFYPVFLKYLQEELTNKDVQLFFVFFSDLMKDVVPTKNNFFYDEKCYSSLSNEKIATEAARIEKEYSFTFKQAFFPDLIQIFRGRTLREITVPKKKFNQIDFLVKRFLFLEKLITDQNIDIIFSDCSPETEMEFGRAIGLKLGKIVLKVGEGNALGRSTIAQLFEFGKERLVEALYNPHFNYNDAENFCEDFIKNKKLPYITPPRYFEQISKINKIYNKFKGKDISQIVLSGFLYPFRYIKRLIFQFYLWCEQKLIKPAIYDKFDPNIPYLFMGFHLNQESTMVLRSMPYTNQVVLVEMLSRVLPYGYYLYVREHPHWPETFSVSYLLKVKKYPNVKLVSPKISIHDIIKHARGVLTYNATTGIEALIYNRPVLSFASNIYYQHHSGVDYCNDLFALGTKLVELSNRIVKKEDTYNYILKLHKVAIDMLLGSDFFTSTMDAEKKAEKFSHYLSLAISWCLKKD